MAGQTLASKLHWLYATTLWVVIEYKEYLITLMVFPIARRQRLDDPSFIRRVFHRISSYISFPNGATRHLYIENCSVRNETPQLVTTTQEIYTEPHRYASNFTKRFSLLTSFCSDLSQRSREIVRTKRALNWFFLMKPKKLEDIWTEESIIIFSDQKKLLTLWMNFIREIFRERVNRWFYAALYRIPTVNGIASNWGLRCKT